MTKEDYLKKYKNETQAPGRTAIDEHLAKFYPQMDFRHYPTQEEDIFYNPNLDALQGVSIFDSKAPENHKHLISYGLSELYFNEKAFGQQFSKWGFELTFRLKPFELDADNQSENFGDPTWAVQVMNNLALFVNETQHWFMPHQFLPINGPIRLECDTDITGIIFVEDPVLGKIDTVHGKVEFLQMVGITTRELEYLLENPNLESVLNLEEKLKKDNPLLITDLNRKSVI
uniref:suppressor of fused domain protein n=1 Tax=Ornithobacterium rhinotracheale TaxID=28251 RepID=UPI0039A637C3